MVIIIWFFNSNRGITAFELYTPDIALLKIGSFNNDYKLILYPAESPLLMKERGVYSKPCAALKKAGAKIGGKNA
jgi:hypothetical protein